MLIIILFCAIFWIMLSVVKTGSQKLSSSIQNNGIFAEHSFISGEKSDIFTVLYFHLTVLVALVFKVEKKT